ncbi:hypothetical protein [Sphingomonas sp. PB4P5]|uniref:hypothetical protein n=1 Tax=Parasphingomonas puruogangriensis TaxID=3096155 RepID=UPI002FC7D0DE
MTDYPLLRASLAPQYAQLPPAQLNDLVRSIYGPNASAEDVEGLFDDIGSGLRHAAGAVGGFAKKAAPALARALPAVASGAAAGSVAGPWGTLIGAGAGLAGGLLSQSGNRTARGIGGAIGSASGLVSTVRGGGATGALGSLASVASGALGNTPAGRSALNGIRGARGGASGGASNMLAGLLARPELTQSLMSSLMGAAGRQSLSVGGQRVPVSQMLSALSNIAGRAAHEAAEAEGSAEDTPEYASVTAEAFGIDPEDSEGRTDALLTLLALTPSIWMNRPAPINVQVNPADPYFPAGENAWAEWDAEASFDENWGQEDWGGEDWSEDYAESDEAVELEDV